MDRAYKIMAIMYELLDEIIGGIMTGVYFCTYFFICAFVLFGNRVFDILNGNNKVTLIIGIPFLSVSYVLGTLFKRGSTELTDTKSVNYIMKKAKQNITNSEYMNDILDSQISDYIDCIKLIKEKYHIRLSISYMENKKRIWQTEEKPNHILFLYAFKRIKSAYKKSNLICMIINPAIKLFGKRILILNREVKKRDELKEFYLTLQSDWCFKVDYPYTHLKKYLEKNGLSDLSKYVTWDSDAGRETKAFINNILSLLTEKQYLGMKQVKKREAHIRFMNSAYHSQRYLFGCSCFVFICVLLLYILRFVWLLKMGYVYRNISVANDGVFVMVIYKFFEYINRIVGYDNLFIIMCVSAIYMMFFGITRKLILGNFHFQRIHEIVYLLQAKQHIECRRQKK